MRIPILAPASASLRGDPPGTYLFDPPEADETAEASRLKRHPKHKHLILRPQPSDSALDPLNWSWARKEVFFLVMLLGSTCTGVIGPILDESFPSQTFGIVSEALGEPIPKIAQLNGILVLFEGIVSVICCITATIWGRRSAYIATTALQLGGCLWGGASTSYMSLYGARILMGGGMAAFAVTIGSSIADVFFTLEHGVRIAWWQVTYLAAVQITPIVSGAIVTRWDWQHCFWILSAFLGITLIGVIFLTPETRFLRDKSTYSARVPPGFDAEKDLEDHQLAGSATPSKSTVGDEKLSLKDQLQFWGRYDDRTVPLWRTALKPVLIIFAPNVFYSMLVYSSCFSWYVFTGATYSQIYSGMVYQESAQSVGNIAGIAPLIGTVAACLVSGPLTDYSARWLSERNHGIFEAEYRLVVLVPAFITTAIGGFGWGATANVDTSIYASTILSAFLFAGATLGVCGAVGYGNACFPAREGDGFSMTMLLSRAYIFGMTYVINDWLAAGGVMQFFSALTGVSLGLYALGLVFYVFGKKMRASFATGPLGWVVE